MTSPSPDSSFASPEDPYAISNIKLMGRKMGMSTHFTTDGRAIPCTRIHICTHTIISLKTPEKDGYTALQLATESCKEKRIKKPLLGQLKAAGIEPRRYLFENRLRSIDHYQVGQHLGTETLNHNKRVDVIGKSKGKGFQGVMKRYSFSGGPASHGSSRFHRGMGSTGMCTYPGRVLPGKKMPGQMGNTRITVRSLTIISIERDFLSICGSIPGAKGEIVFVRQ